MIGRKDLQRYITSLALLTTNILRNDNSCFSQSVPTRDSMVTRASLKYKHPGIFISLAIGGNYRKEWEQPVRLPIFDITKEHGGFTITKLGGGVQTKSLRMQAADSTEWVLRSVDKDVKALLPRLLRQTVAETFMQDMVSASHPYGSLSVVVLAHACGVFAPDPVLFYVPDDSALGDYRKEFAGRVCFLEKRHPVKAGTKPEKMEDLLNDLLKENNKIVLQKEFLRARLVDMLTGDWDRHQGQWRWGAYDSLDKTWYYPIPVDRDQAFFRPKGVLVRMINTIGTGYLKGFKPGMTGLYQLNRSARNVDRAFLNELPVTEWRRIIKEIQETLNDSLITAAINKLPCEIPAKRKNRIARTLTSRRNGLLTAGMKYYSRLSKNIFISGTEQAELFVVKSINDGLTITVYNCIAGNRPCKIYERTFYNNQTRRIYLSGITANDKIDMQRGIGCKIKIVQIDPESEKKYNLRKKILKRLKAKGQG